jgi:transposase-like protein
LACARPAAAAEWRLVAYRLVGTPACSLGEIIVRLRRSQESTPRTITFDGCAASHRAVREMKADSRIPEDGKGRSSKYLNNLIEQDHRAVKSRLVPMLGFKALRTAAITIAGVELMRRLHKGQFNLRGLRLKDRSTSAVWAAGLAAQ